MLAVSRMTFPVFGGISGMDEDDGEHRTMRSMSSVRARHRGGNASVSVARPQRAGDDPALDVGGAGAHERARGLGERGAGGHHVVDQRDPRAANVARARQTRRGRCARAPSTPAPPAASRPRRARAAPSSGSADRARHAGARFRAPG